VRGARCLCACLLALLPTVRGVCGNRVRVASSDVDGIIDACFHPLAVDSVVVLLADRVQLFRVRCVASTAPAATVPAPRLLTPSRRVHARNAASCRASTHDVTLVEELRLPADVRPVAMCFGALRRGWERFTLFLVDADGAGFAVCPWLPPATTLPSAVWAQLVHDAEARDDEVATAWLRECWVQGGAW
jgi:hypothetical protein